MKAMTEKVKELEEVPRYEDPLLAFELAASNENIERAFKYWRVGPPLGSTPAALVAHFLAAEPLGVSGIDEDYVASIEGESLEKALGALEGRIIGPPYYSTNLDEVDKWLLHRGPVMVRLSAVGAPDEAGYVKPLKKKSPRAHFLIRGVAPGLTSYHLFGGSSFAWIAREHLEKSLDLAAGAIKTP